MNRQSLSMVAAALAVAVVSLAPLTARAQSNAAGSHASSTSCVKQKQHKLDTGGTTPVLRVGISGGNIRPWSLAVLPTGAISINGPITSKYTQIADPADTLRAVLALLDADGFWTLKTHLLCPPRADIATRFIGIHTANGDRTVQATGACNTRFNELYALLMNMVGLATG